MNAKNEEAQEPNKQGASEETVWTYRGYRLKTGEFVTAMAHLFRAEVQRANVWRQRLDTTTNWAVVSTGASLSIAFSQQDVHHAVILLNLLLVFWFLVIEARRYRYYELWSYRVRLMETDFYAPMLVPPFHPSPEWAESLAESLLLPSFPISMLEALGSRLRRNYLWIFIINGAAWAGKIWLFPTAPNNLQELIERAAVGHIQGEVIAGFLGALYVLLVTLTLATIRATQATGEALPRFGDESAPDAPNQEGKAGNWQRLFKPHRRRKQLLALIITEKAESVSSRILSDLKRGVTAMQGKGMYTGKERAILMCALTVTEAHNLKAAVAKEDPKAVVIVAPAQEILGAGFAPLKEA